MVFKSKFADVKPDERYKDLVSNFFYEQLDRFASKLLFLDHASGRKWTGAQIKATCCVLARGLMRSGLAANDECVFFYEHNDHITLGALAALFAGAGVCYWKWRDPEYEHAYMLDVMQPTFVFVHHSLLDEMLRLRASSGAKFTLVVMDDDCLGTQEFQETVSKASKHPTETTVLGFHRDLLSGAAQADASGPASGGNLEEATPTLPVQVDPNRPAFTLLTSGSTGNPKPVGRSQRNSLYVCHSFLGHDLWDLNESSVIAAHLALDHGTGIFLLKQCLTRGFTSVIMNDYDDGVMLAAIGQYKITDLVLGSAYVHNLLSSREVQSMMRADAKDAERAVLSSLRNIIAVGSSIVLTPVVGEFMACYSGCSVRQAYGMTEAGFLAIIPRALTSQASSGALSARAVGWLLPNVEMKLVARLPESGSEAESVTGAEGEEIVEFDCAGELYVRGPTVSPGYVGERFAEQTRAKFLEDGFYKSDDMCSIDRDGMLHVFGRFNDVLCLTDGAKVLPGEIEQLLLTHPHILEAAVVGLPHPQLPTCHAPRAYIVPRDGVEVVADDEMDQEELSLARADTKRICARQVHQFVACRLAEFKHLSGGVRFVECLPRISIGKVDRRALRQLEVAEN